jgi:aspartate carbamoyltransferase catalytic subunit
MLRLGGGVLAVNEQQSSVKKGESLEDTIRTLASYCDAVVIRHPMKGSADIATEASTKPIINAGDGTGEHPTQGTSLSLIYF